MFKWLRAQCKENNLTIAILVVGSLFLGTLIQQTVDNNLNCSGIGGFVQNEIDWHDQTKNILLHSCSNNDNVPILFYNQQKKQFYCYKNYDCDINNKNCRSKEVYFNTIG